MTAIAKIITDTELFPELDGESVCPKSMSEVKDTIDVIVKLPTVLNSDNKKFFDFVEKMRNKYGSDQVIWMNAENADQIEDSKLNSVFSELEEALSDLDTCFAEPEPQKEFVKAYNRLAKAVDKVLAVMSKIKPTTEAAGNTLNEAVTAIDKKKMTSIAELVSDRDLFPELDGESLNPDSSVKRMQSTIDVIAELATVLDADKKTFFDFVGKMRNKYGSDQVIWMNAENADQIEDSKLNSVFSELEEALSDLDVCFAEPLTQKEFVKAYNRLAKAVDKVLAATK
jgi:DNA-binding SARP family transcriptional activator